MPLLGAQEDNFMVNIVDLALMAAQNLSRGETHVFVHCTSINLMKVPNVETHIFLVPASNHFMF